MKRILTVLLAVLLLALLPVAAFAEQTRVFDLAGLLSDDDTVMLEQLIADFTAGYALDVVVLTTDDTEGKSARTYGEEFYEQNGFGIGDEYDGFLMLVDMGGREVQLITYGRAIDILNDDRIELILDAQYEYLADGDFGGAFLAGIGEAGYYATEGPPEDRHRYDEDTDEVIPSPSYEPRDWTLRERLYVWRHVYGHIIMIALLVGLSAAGVITWAVSASYKKEFKPVPYDYRSQGDLKLSTRQDRLVNRFVTTRVIKRDPPPSSGGGGGGGARSTVHRTGGGRVSGGGGRKF